MQTFLWTHHIRKKNKSILIKKYIECSCIYKKIKEINLYIQSDLVKSKEKNL
jgi:hypothetical protein